MSYNPVMEIKPFKVEEWMNEYEKEAVYDIAGTCVKNFSLSELFSFCGVDERDFMHNLSQKTLTYLNISGSDEYKNGICSLYKTLKPENVLSTVGAAGANHLVFYSLIEPGDEVVSVVPTYQQLYSIPESFGAMVKILRLRPENDFLPDLEEFAALVTPKTRLICLNNPNNPTGALIDDDLLKKISNIAEKNDAYVLCDEVYRGLEENSVSSSIVDIYEKGISTGSMSKTFSLAGVRAGWVATKDKKALASLFSHREYSLICCSVLDEAISALALENAGKIINRNKKILAENREILNNWLSAQNNYYCCAPKAGTTALLYYKKDVSSKVFCDRLSKQKGVFTTPGFCFELENCFRIGYGCEKSLLKRGLELLNEFADGI